MKYSKFLNFFSLVPASLCISALVAFPLIVILWMSAQGDSSTWQHIQATLLPEYISNSLAIMLGVALFSLLLGVGSAWIIARYQFGGRSTLQWMLLLPLAMPGYITAYSYTGLLDVPGPIQTYIRERLNLNYGEYWFPNIHSLGGAIFVLSAVLYPYIYLLARSAFAEQPSSLERSSTLLGTNRIKRFWLISLPIARPAIAAGLALTLMETLSDYGTVAYFGISTFTTGIFRAWLGMGEINSAAQLSLILMLFVVALMALEQYSRHRARFFEKGNHSKHILIKLNAKGSSIAFILCSIPLLIGFIIPNIQLVYWAIGTFSDVVDEHFYQLALNSLSLAMATAVIAISLALILSTAKRINAHNYLVSFAHKVVISGYAIPGTVIAVGLLSPVVYFDKALIKLLKTSFDIEIGLILSGTIAALIIAYLVRFLSVSVQTIDSGFKKIPPQIEQAAQSLGASNKSLLWHIHIPIISTSILTAGLIVFVDVMKELPATLLLRPFNFNTLAIKSFELASDEQLAEAAPAALAIVLFGLIPVILLSKTIQRQPTK